MAALELIAILAFSIFTGRMIWVSGGVMETFRKTAFFMYALSYSMEETKAFFVDRMKYHYHGARRSIYGVQQ